MKYMDGSQSGGGVGVPFRKAAAQPTAPRKTSGPPPFSIRFSEDERARLNRDAGNMPLSAYVRQKLLGDAVTKRKSRYRKKQRLPNIDHETLARLLGVLGQSELATSMIALALAAQSGAMPVIPELSENLIGDATISGICGWR